MTQVLHTIANLALDASQTVIDGFLFICYNQLVVAFQ